MTSGWWVDARVPDLSGILTPRLGVDVEQFTQWYAPRLGVYRSEMQARAAVARPAKNLLRIAKDASDLAALLRDVSPPAREIFSATLIGANPLRRLPLDLEVVATVAKVANAGLANRPGRKTEKARAVLLREVISQLRLTIPKATIARDVAKQILMLSGVALPARESGIRKAARK